MRRAAAVVVLRQRSPAWALLEVLRRRRRVTLRPAVYAGVGLAGLVAGLLLPVAWWIPPLALLALAWTGPVVAGSGSGANGPTLRAELLDAVHPSGALRRHDERTIALVRTAAFPVYGVAGWPGARALGGHSTSGRSLTEVELAFLLDGTVDGPSVRVSSTTTGLDGVRAAAVLTLAGSSGRRAPGEDPGALPAELDARSAALAARPWERVEVPVDGQPRPAELLRADDAWVVVLACEGLVVVVAGDRVPWTDVALEQVVDLEPYVDGLRRLHVPGT